MEGAFQELLKAWGPPGIVAVLLWVILVKAEKRETLKDQRIQLLENKLTESYDERITIADQMSTGQYKVAEALTNLTNEIRQSRKGVR